jgi:hypothetical protein
VPLARVSCAAGFGLKIKPRDLREKTKCSTNAANARRQNRPRELHSPRSSQSAVAGAVQLEHLNQPARHSQRGPGCSRDAAVRGDVNGRYPREDRYTKARCQFHRRDQGLPVHLKSSSATLWAHITTPQVSVTLRTLQASRSAAARAAAAEYRPRSVCAHRGSIVPCEKHTTTVHASPGDA